ncbi:MAG: transcriptional regulator HexR [Oceanospirillaceae bacterium]|jgi:RpiR family carbohydrate utilization transcriptional regulator|nr:transcriptional regulator HexR [Oceanospirillaceae bacterium]MBT4443543.1 transcriptional regulator HexR [Oceanospirillaceae bacterium]MBT6077776.1 transcriptional regulator HexR [Oceanospirillaceae bacterium]MBT7331440.1 transcriptional regulator HexR [Oceanospirillaceae bacterium]
MTSNNNLLQQLVQQQDQLNRSERKVAQVIVADPRAATRMSIAALAGLAQVSEPTVNRMCRSFGLKGYPDFKLELAQSMASGTPYVSQSVGQNDTASQYTDKIFTSTIASLDAARQQVDSNVVQRAVDYLSQAQQICFCGMGASGAVAQDALHKFFRFNIPVVAHNDSLMMRMMASACKRGDVLVLLSFTGRTKEMVEVARIGRAAGAVVVAITAVDSPLAQEATLVLGVDAPEDTDVYMPMQSRLIQLTLLDVLATGVILRRGEDFHHHLKTIKQSLKGTRVALAEDEV